ncbi:hypothetical protein BVRB_1g015240 [Beta vulgaris subsp. vulgaris]|nr:hypothetical protein BVRB_1g015240 [Beta vulgaris subsp. vulgaris]
MEHHVADIDAKISSRQQKSSNKTVRDTLINPTISMIFRHQILAFTIVGSLTLQSLIYHPSEHLYDSLALVQYCR